MLHTQYVPVWFNNPCIIRFMGGKFSIKWGKHYDYCPISPVDAAEFIKHAQ